MIVFNICQIKIGRIGRGGMKLPTLNSSHTFLN